MAIKIPLRLPFWDSDLQKWFHVKFWELEIIFPHCGVETSWLSSFQTSPGGFIGNLTSILKIAGLLLLLLHACRCHARPKKQKRALSYTARTLHQTNARSLSKTMSIKAPEEWAQQVTGCQEGTLTGFPKLHRCNFGDFMEKCQYFIAWLIE